MSYPGNNALASHVQERILGTFEQTLDLAVEGNRQEALLGCDFVLRMDPLFEPARRLQERLAAGNGTVAVDDLRRGAYAVAQETASDLFGDLDDLDFELPKLPAAESDLAAELQELLDARRFHDLLQLAERERATVMAEPQLRGLAETAQARLEAEPYTLKFLTAALQARQEGRHDEVEKLLAKAKSLDPSHPGIAGLEGTPGLAELEEELPVDFMMEAPGSAFPSLELPHPAAGLFDTPSAPGGDSESERRIAELLDEGQRAFDRGDNQAAIDAWSRIFLIDIDHQEAARRIEQARRLNAEQERQVEEIFHEGLASFEAGDAVSARRRFERVLALQPGHFAAREHLQQLDAGGPLPRAAAGLAEPALSLPDLPEEDDGILKEEILVPPEPGRAPARASEKRPATVAARQSRPGPGRTFALIGGVVLALAVAGGWFLWSNWDRLFPNSTSADELAAATPRPAAEADPVAAASTLHEQGKTALALSRLKRLRPDHPRYADAQALIAQWEGTSAPAPATAAPPPEQAEIQERLLKVARRAHADGDDLTAIERFAQAAAIAPLAVADSDLQAAANRRLAPLAREVEYFRQHEWELVLPELWRLREKDPANPLVERLIVDSYYNLAVQDLVRNDAAKAAEKLEQALELAPGDARLKRHHLFAQSYRDRPKDLQYRIYVKHLPFR